MRYFEVNMATGEKKEITKEQAKEIVSIYYVENECTYEELISYPGFIRGAYRSVEIVKE